MYENEISQALDSGNFEVLWLYMVKRTSWLQHAELSADELSAAQESTKCIMQGLASRMIDLQTKLGATRRHVQLVGAYEGVGSFDGTDSRQKV